MLALFLLVAFSTCLADVIKNGHQGPDQLAHTWSKKWTMETWINMGEDGKIHGKTTLKSKSIEGFTGGVAVVLFDENKKELWNSSEWHKFGVNLFSSRTAEWDDQVPTNLVPKVKYFSIAHKHTPKHHFWEWLEKHWPEILKIIQAVLSSSEKDDGLAQVNKNELAPPQNDNNLAQL